MDRTVKETVARNLQNLRWKHNWTQRFVCAQIQVSIRTLSRAETGKGISRAVLQRLAILYKVPIEKLFDRNAEYDSAGVTINPLPFDVVVRLLNCSDFVNQIQKETLLHFNCLVRDNAPMTRDEAEAMLANILSDKRSYSKTDLIMATIEASHETIRRVGNLITS